MLADIFGPDLLIVAIVLVVLLFGGAAIPKLARNLGSAKNQFEKGMEEGKTGASTRRTSAAADAPAPAPRRGEDAGRLRPERRRPPVPRVRPGRPSTEQPHGARPSCWRDFHDT